MNNYFIGVAIFIITSCNNRKLTTENRRFCDCLTISKTLNNEASKYSKIDMDELSDSDISKFKHLIKEKDSLCEPFEWLSADELKPMRDNCIEK